MKRILLSAVAVILGLSALVPAASAHEHVSNISELGTKYDTMGSYAYYKTAESFSSGSGTADDPYMISTWEEFNLMNDVGCGDEGIGKYFALSQEPVIYEVDFPTSGYAWAWVKNKCIGSEDKPFQGTFDGNGYYLPSSEFYAFNVIGENGTVQNVNGIAIARVNHGLIESCSSTVNSAGDKGENSGLMAGKNTGTIRRCKAVAKSTAVATYIFRSNQSGVGIICGYNQGGIIEECYAKGSLRGDSKSSRAYGGIVGDNSGGIVRNCFSDGFVESKGTESGGIAGRLNDGIIENCVAVSFPNGSLEYAGSIAGAIYGNSQIINSYASGLTVGNATPENAFYGYDKQTELMQKSTYKDLNFDNIWCIKPNDFPRLRFIYHFSDMHNHWARDIVEELYENGSISGYGDGTFHPDDTVTKAEFIVMISERRHDGYIPDTKVSYTDIPDWAMPYLKYAIYYNRFDEHIAVSDTLLGANEPITRLEAGVLAGSAAWNRITRELNFTDLDEIPEWAIEKLEKAYGNFYIRGYEDKSFRPYGTLTRAEAATIADMIKLHSL